MAIIQMGMGSLAKRPIMPLRISGGGGGGGLRRRVSGIGRIGWAGEGASQSTCPSGQWNANLQTCCAPGDGTVAAMDDPCSLFNQQPYLSEMATVQAQAIAGDAGNQSGTLAELNNAGYSQPVQTAALTCVSNPGLSYVDNWGNPVTCPADEVNDNGIMVSAFTPAQLAAMIQPKYASGPLPNSAVNTVQSNPNVIASSAPVVKTVTPAPQTNALSNSAAQTTTGSGVTPTAVANTSNVSGNSSNGQGGAPAPDVTVGGVDITSWLESNWILVAAGAAALLILPGLMKGGR